MIQRQNPVEWVVDWPLAWLLTYSGSDCELWKKVLEKCMGSELCRKTMELLSAIGYDLRRHKCYDLLDVLDAEIIDQAPTPPKHQNQNSSTTQATSQTNHSKTKLPNRLDAYARVLPVNPPNPPKPTHSTPLLITGGAAPDRGAWPTGDGWPGLQSLWAGPRQRGVPTGRVRWAPDLQGYGRWGFPPTHGQWAPELQDRGPTEGGCLGRIGEGKEDTGNA